MYMCVVQLLLANGICSWTTVLLSSLHRNPSRLPMLLVHSFSFNSKKGQETNGTRKEVEPCYTELSTHHLLSDQIKVGHGEVGSKVVLLVCLFLFHCSKTPPAKFNDWLFFWGTGEFPVICYHGRNFRRKVARCGLFCLHLEWLGGGVRRLWATDPSVKLLIEEKNTPIHK